MTLLLPPLLSLGAALMGCLSSPTQAQETPQCTELTGARVWTPKGVVQQTVVLAGERIVQVGEQRAAGWGGGDCVSVDLSAHLLTPGLIDSQSSVGLVEVSAEHGAHRSGGRPAVEVVWDYNPQSVVVQSTRHHGVTAAILTGRGQWSGAMGLVELGGATLNQAVVQPAVAQGFRLGHPATDLLTLSEILADVDAYRADPRAHARGESREYLLPPADLLALQPVADGRVPLVVTVNKASHIEALLAWHAEHPKLRLVLSGASEAWVHAQALAQADIAVILNPQVQSAESFHTLQGRPDNAALLAQAGVAVIIASSSGHEGRELTQLAGLAVRAGMDHSQALAALTQTPAQVFGLEGQGALRPGARANLVAWTGDPLELRTRAAAVWIAGEQQALVGRQELLMERYSQPEPPTLTPVFREP
ncbi:MAG: amidohydrolase family protein [Myxococcota bacterium]|nr:amidohydrolase family protein [Myxococcota bacterium]